MTFIVDALVGVNLEFYLFSSQNGKSIMNKLDSWDILNSIAISGIELGKYILKIKRKIKVFQKTF